MKLEFLTLIVAITFYSSISNAQTIKDFAGNGPSNTVPSGPNYSGDGGLAINASLAYMGSVAIDTSGNVFIADNINNRIREVNPAGIISTFLSGYSSEYIAFDKSGNLYAELAFSIIKINSSGVTNLIAGNAAVAGSYTGDGGPATAAGLNNPSGMAFDTAGNIYFSDLGNNVVRKINAAGIITTGAGTGYTITGGTGGYSGDGGPATAARLSYPQSLLIDSAGNLLIADAFNYRVRRVSALTGIITTIAGSGPTWPTLITYSGEGGPATNAVFAPAGMAFDESGNLFISDVFTERIFKVNSSGNVATVAGNGTADYYGDGGPASAARFHNPDWISFDVCGNMYISDDENNRIRKIIFNPPPVTPAISISASPSSALPGTLITLNAIVTGASSYSITWIKNGLAFSTTTVPTTTYTKSAGNDSITAIVSVYVTKACYANGQAPTIPVFDLSLNVSNAYSFSPDIYPNPTSDILNIDNLQTITTYKILNLLGTNVQHGLLQKSNNIIGIQDIVAGVYILELTTNEGARTIIRFVKV